MTKTRRPRHDEVNLAPMAFWDSTPTDREAVFANLRATRPVSGQPPSEGGMIAPGPADDGFWAVTGHAAVLHVSSHPELFSNVRKGFLLDDIPLEYYAVSGSVLFADPPEHTKLRRLVSAAFTPRHVRQIEDQISAQARVIIDDLLAVRDGECDFMRQVAQRMPMWTIAEAMGIPAARRQDVADVANSMNSTHDPEIQKGRTPEQVMVDAMTYLHQAARELADERREDPRDDLMTALVHADIDGEKLSDQEICAFFLLLTVAGNDTTRNATGLAMRLLTENPDQSALLTSDLTRYLPNAIEEFLRFAAPVMTMRRTATQDLELEGCKIAEGDKVVLFYAAANFDETVFPDPTRFDITRTTNPHVSFGSPGPHYCLGAPLARAQLRALFTELLTRVPDIEVGKPEYELSNFICAIKRMPCRFTPTLSS